MSEKKTLPVFFVVETSSNMAGEAINEVNSFMEGAIAQLKELQKENDDSPVKIAVLAFSSGVKWVTKGLVDLDSINRKDFSAGGNADIGAAYKALNEALSQKKGLLKDIHTYDFCPAIVLLANGNYTGNWENPLEELKQNIWFQKFAQKIVFTFGENINDEVLKGFVYSPDFVLRMSPPNFLRKFIRFSKISSHPYLDDSDEPRDLP